jgi:hypothetical protein
MCRLRLGLVTVDVDRVLKLVIVDVDRVLEVGLFQTVGALTLTIHSYQSFV